MFACYTIFYSWFASLFSDCKFSFSITCIPFLHMIIMNMTMTSEATGYAVHFSFTISTQINIQHGWVRAISRNAYPLECMKSLKVKTSGSGRRKQIAPFPEPFYGQPHPNKHKYHPFWIFWSETDKKCFYFKKRHVMAAE